MTTIETVDKARYVTAGDYFFRDGELVIQVVKQANPDYEFLVALHEYFEQYATAKDGVSEQEITQWDTEHPQLDEPGADPNAPYHKRHVQAELLERMAAEFLGVDWQKYEQEIRVSE